MLCAKTHKKHERLRKLNQQNDRRRIEWLNLLVENNLSRNCGKDVRRWDCSSTPTVRHWQNNWRTVVTTGFWSTRSMARWDTRRFPACLPELKAAARSLWFALVDTRIVPAFSRRWTWDPRESSART